MYPWRRILIPTDFSTASEWAFDDAIHLAGATGAELVILHIRMTHPSRPSELRFPADDALYEYAEREELQKLRDRARRANASVATRMVVRTAPDPSAEIHRAALDEHADLIVIATHARHHVAHLIIGSTTMAVITNPPAPVLAIRYGIRKRLGMRRILLPVHLQQTSSAAAELAAAIARPAGMQVDLLIVCDEVQHAAADELLRELTERVFTGVQAKPVVVRGDDIQRELVRYADEHDVDAVFLNAQSSVSEMKQSIIRHIAAPVMIVPA